MSLGDNLSKFLKDFRGSHSQEWLAREIGVSRMTVYRWEKSGAGGATLDELDRIAKKIGRPAADLVGIVAEEPKLASDLRVMLRGLAALDELQLSNALPTLLTAIDLAKGHSGELPRRKQNK